MTHPPTHDESPRPPWAESIAVREDLRPFLGWVLARNAELGGVTEIRIIGKGERAGIWSTYLRPGDEDVLVAQLAPVTPRPRPRIPSGDHPRVGEANIYFGLHPADPRLARRDRPTIRRVRTTTKDRDVVAYSILAVDVDPERQPRDRSATDAEKAEAREVAEQVRGWLRERGVEPMWADSGNGFHLLVPLVPASREAVPQAAKDAHALLRLLDERFSTAGAKVDASTFNPSRILKLYGTVAAKGVATAEHPHRLSSIDLASIPDDVDLFARLAEEFEHGPPPVSRRQQPPAPSPRVPATRPTTETSPTDWRAWRARAVAALPLEAVYGELLTGKAAGAGWLQCRDPDSPSGDRHPSAGVAEGSGEAERGSFHSFRSGETCSAFDFLVRVGRAADFRAACAVVAELSGVPLPAGRSATRSPTTSGGPGPAGIVARFESRWSRASSDAERNRLVRSVIERLLAVPAIEREPLLATVRERAGIGTRVFRATVAEVKKAQRRARRAPPSPSPGARAIDYVTNCDSVEALFDRLADAIGPLHRFFNTGRDLVFVDPGVGPIPVHDKNLGGLLSSLVEIRFLSATENGDSFQRFGVLPSDLTRAFVTSPRVRRRLPKLEAYARSPVFDKGWNFVGRPGFHEASGIFYDGPEVRPKRGTDRLRSVLRDFHWKAEADLVNFVGALLTAVTMPNWGRGHPFLAINGNKPGVGKSTLARTLGVVVEGGDPNTVSFTPDDAEFEKQLATRVEAGDRVIVIDNAKPRRGIQSAVLERCITDTRLNFRRLGSNTAITRPVNDLLVCLTMNMTQLGPDLRRRALPVNLELDASVRSATYPVDDIVAVVTEHRVELVAELAGMVLAWSRAGRPACESPARHSTGQRWAGTMDAILRGADFEGFLTNFEASEHAFDPKYQLMLEVCQEQRGKPAATAAQWAEWLADGPLEDRFTDRRGKPKSARARATIVGNLFTEYLDAVFVVDGSRYGLDRAYPNGATRSATYRFREGPAP